MYLFFPFSPFVCFACFCFVAVDFVFIHYWPIFFVWVCFKVYLFFFHSVYFTCSFHVGLRSLALELYINFWVWIWNWL